MYFVYFLKSEKNQKFYVGVTSKRPEQRLQEHNFGSNKWTRENSPFKIVYYEKYYCKADAYQRELFYKSGFGRKVRDAIIETVKSAISSVG